MAEGQNLKELGYSKDYEETLNYYDEETKNYILEATNHPNCKLLLSKNGWPWHIQILSNLNGLYFLESIYISSQRTIMDGVWFSDDPEDVGNRGYNRNKNTLGIPIWETTKLLEKCLVCDSCGKRVSDISELHGHHYAGACCDDCLAKEQEDWDSKPNGYWTH